MKYVSCARTAGANPRSHMQIKLTKAAIALIVRRGVGKKLNAFMTMLSSFFHVSINIKNRACFN